jgi:5-methylcytosine-specific restriction endonuclease McrA
VIARHKLEHTTNVCVSFFGPPSDGPTYDKKKYEHLTLAIRQTVLERARNRCQKCGVKFTASVQPQFEHINSSQKDNRPINLRALCPQCYKSVEEKENRKGIFSSIRSRFG